MIENLQSKIGNTPLVRITKYEEKNKIDNQVFVKIEKYNPSGSVKDRASFYMVKDAFEKGLIDKDTTIIEPTSGNTGIGLAYIGSLLKLKVIIVMPTSMSEERRKLIKQYGASLELVEGSMADCIEKAKKLAKEIPNSYIPSQFDNHANTLAHYETTGPEIYNELNDIDILICGIGTGGTISGTAKYLKERIPNLKVIGVEPKSSPIISEGRFGKHKIQGIGAGFIPSILDLNIIDEIVQVEDENAIICAKEINKIENIFVGISSGAALDALKQISNKYINKKIVVILPDGGERYSWN